MNVIHLLDEQAKRVPERLALIMQKDGKTQTISFSELNRQTAVFATALKNCGLEAGDRVILMIPMSIELYVTMLGIIRMGAVAIFVDPWIGARQIADFAAFAEPRGYVGIGKSHLLRLFNKTLRRLPVTVTAGKTILGLPAKWSQKKLLDTTPDWSIYESSSDDSALITFTSGSSGIPKGANRTHGFLTAQHQALQQEFPYDESDVDMPMFPVFALNNLARGLTSVVPDMDFRKVAEVDAQKIAAQIREFGVTTATASPPFFDRLAKITSEKPCFRRILTGGAPVSVDQLKVYRQAWPDTEVQVVFGSTEAEPVAHISLEDRLEAESGEKADLPGYCVGKPIQAITAGVIPVLRENVPKSAIMANLLLPAGEIGELVVTGAHVCRDYFRNPEAVAANKILDDSGQIWHRMGDTGYFDPDGNFRLVGRVHSTVFTVQGPLHAQIVEKKAIKIFGCRCALLGFKDPENPEFERGLLVVNGKISAEKRAMVVDFDPFIELVEYLEPFPLDPRHNSKVDYAELKRLVES